MARKPNDLQRNYSLPYKESRTEFIADTINFLVEGEYTEEELEEIFELVRIGRKQKLTEEVIDR